MNKKSEKPNLAELETVILDAATFHFYQTQSPSQAHALLMLCEDLEKKYDRNVLCYNRFDAEIARIMAFDKGIKTGVDYAESTAKKKASMNATKALFIFSFGIFLGLLIAKIM